MANLRATTAIADAPFESLAAKTLFDNGWDVEKRVLDAHAITVGSDELLLISLDLEGLTQERFNDLCESGARIIAFGPNPRSLVTTRVTTFEPTLDSAFLLSILRGNQREPLLQVRRAPTRRAAELMYICSARPAVGGSFIAANIAMELSALQKKVLLVDGDITFPSLYDHLGVRDLAEPQTISPYLTVVELRATEQETHLQRLERWSHEFEYIVLDGGAISDCAALGQDRRLAAGLVMWGMDRAQHHIAITTTREIDLAAHRTMLANLAKFKHHISMTTIINQSRKGAHYAIEGKVVELPSDVRTVTKCAREKLLLSEAAPRSPLTKQIAQFVREGLV